MSVYAIMIGSLCEWVEDRSDLPPYGSPYTYIDITTVNPLPAAGWTFSGGVWTQPVAQANQSTITTAAHNALTNNATFLSSGAPTYPLTTAEQQALVAQVVALTRQMDGVIRLLLQQFDATT